MRKTKLNHITKKPFSKEDIRSMKRQFKFARIIFLYELIMMGLTPLERESLIFSPMNYNAIRGLDMNNCIEY